MSDPSVSRTAKVSGITSLMDSAKASESTKNAMAAMAEGGRLGDVFKVMDLYGELLTAAKGEVAAIITSAKPLSDAEVKQIQDSLGQFLVRRGAETLLAARPFAHHALPELHAPDRRHEMHSRHQPA